MDPRPRPNFRFSKRSAKNFTKTLVVAAALVLGGCGGKPVFHQPGSNLDHIYARTFLTDYNTAWQAALEALKSFDKTVTNRQGGVIQTQWLDNTAQKNFTESFGGDVSYLKARYRLNLSIAPITVRGGKHSVKVSILKDQMIQRDLLEGWKQVESDAIEENTFLYRIGRIIYIKLRLKQMEEDKVRKIEEEGV